MRKTLLALYIHDNADRWVRYLLDTPKDLERFDGIIVYEDGRQFDEATRKQIRRLTLTQAYRFFGEAVGLAAATNYLLDYASVHGAEWMRLVSDIQADRVFLHPLTKPRENIAMAGIGNVPTGGVLKWLISDRGITGRFIGTRAWVDDADMWCRVDAWREVAGMDANYYHGAEVIDVQLKLLHQGYTIQVWEYQTINPTPESSLQSYFAARNLYLLVAKHASSRSGWERWWNLGWSHLKDVMSLIRRKRFLYLKAYLAGIKDGARLWSTSGYWPQ